MSIIWRDADYFTCPACRFKYCTNENCYGDWGKHSGLSCKQFKLKYKINDDQKLFEELQKKQGWMTCPKCFAIIEKKGGSCNIMKCESRKCSKKTIFCYLCGEELKESTKNNHFPKGEFSSCVNTMKPNERREQEEIKIENPQEPQKRENEKENFEKETDHNDTHDNINDVKINMPTQHQNIKYPDVNMEHSKKIRGAQMSIWMRIGYWFWNLIRCFSGLFCCQNKYDCPNCSKTHTIWFCLFCCIMFGEEITCPNCQEPSKHCSLCLVGRKRKIPCKCGNTIMCKNKNCLAPINEMDVSKIRHNNRDDIENQTRIDQII